MKSRKISVQPDRERHLRGSVILFLVVTVFAVVGIAVAEIPIRTFLCDTCFGGPNDLELVCGEPQACKVHAEVCFSYARDFDNDGRIDEVVNRCETNPRS